MEHVTRYAETITRIVEGDYFVNSILYNAFVLKYNTEHSQNGHLPINTNITHKFLMLMFNVLD